MSRRAVLLLSTMLATLVAASGVALGANQIIHCQTNVPCNGTNQNDTLIGTAEDDTIHGLGGADLLFGLDSTGIEDSLYGDAGHDLLIGGNGADSLYGGPGNDVSNGGNLHDFYYFEANNWGQDTIVDSNNSNGIEIESPVTANLQIFLPGDNTLNPEVSDTAGINGTNTVNWKGDAIKYVFNFGSGDDTIFADDRANSIKSYHGTDRVYGAGGDDVIDVRDLGAYSDYVDCGPGDDTVYIDVNRPQGDVYVATDIVNNATCEHDYH